MLQASIIVLTVEIIQARVKATSLLFLKSNMKSFMFCFVCGLLVSIKFGVCCHCIIQAVDQACSPSSKKKKKECWRFVTSLVAITKTDSVVQDFPCES